MKINLEQIKFNDLINEYGNNETTYIECDVWKDLIWLSEINDNFEYEIDEETLKEYFRGDE